MKYRYLAFHYEEYSQAGGMNDCVYKGDDLAEAKKAAIGTHFDSRFQSWEIYDCLTGAIGTPGLPMRFVVQRKSLGTHNWETIAAFNGRTDAEEFRDKCTKLEGETPSLKYRVYETEDL